MSRKQRSVGDWLIGIYEISVEHTERKHGTIRTRCTWSSQKIDAHGDKPLARKLGCRLWDYVF